MYTIVTKHSSPTWQEKCTQTEKKTENKVFLYHQTSISYISGKGILRYSKNVGGWLHVYINMGKKVHAEKSGL